MVIVDRRDLARPPDQGGDREQSEAEQLEGEHRLIGTALDGQEGQEDGHGHDPGHKHGEAKRAPVVGGGPWISRPWRS